MSTRPFCSSSFMKSAYVASAFSVSQKEAQQQFRNQVSEFALEIAGKIVHDQMKDDQARNRLVDNMLDQIESKN